MVPGVSLWLSKSLVAAVSKQLGDGAVATANLPRMHKALKAQRPDIATWSAECTNLSALVVADVSSGWESLAEAWRSTLAPEGVLLAIGGGSASEASRKLLCAGFTDLHQATVGRKLVTSGRLGLQP
tara:strand:+ start:1826 stop:2206 length:381 start_codon:yes stop_codon:yes gene_type:complete